MTGHAPLTVGSKCLITPEMSSHPKQIDSTEKVFQSDVTRDGSISLRHPGGETMHSREGALSETKYIYYPLARAILQQSQECHACVVGLGLGYIEFGVICEWIKSGKSTSISLLSYESDEGLRNCVSHWAMSEPYTSEITQKPLSHELTPRSSGVLYFEEISRAAQLVADLYSVPIFELKTAAKFLLTEKLWLLLGELNEQSVQPGPKVQCNAIFYDAFSGRTDGMLWDQTFLVQFLESHAHRDCLFSTYAAVGALNRALRESDFKRVPRDGFAHKRESTWACRGNLIFLELET